MGCTLAKGPTEARLSASVAAGSNRFSEERERASEERQSAPEEHQPTSEQRQPGAEERKPRTVFVVIADMARDPRRYLISNWNWKSALLSSLMRAGIFFSANLTAGLHAALGAMLAELVLRSATSGFYGAITEAFASAEPPWAATFAAMILLPLAAHSLEFLVHWFRGTPNLAVSIASSVLFTAISTSFNMHAMRRGALTVGRGSRPLHEDFGRMPDLIWSYFTAGPRAIAGVLWRKSS